MGALLAHRWSSGRSMRGQINEAAAHVDSALKWDPNDVGTFALRKEVLRAARAAQGAP